MINDAFLDELREILDGKFTGKLILHVDRGRVRQYEKSERHRPKNPDGFELVVKDNEVA